MCVKLLGTYAIIMQRAICSRYLRLWASAFPKDNTLHPVAVFLYGISTFNWHSTRNNPFRPVCGIISGPYGKSILIILHPVFIFPMNQKISAFIAGVAQSGVQEHGGQKHQDHYHGFCPGSLAMCRNPLQSGMLILGFAQQMNSGTGIHTQHHQNNFILLTGNSIKIKSFTTF